MVSDLILGGDVWVCVLLSEPGSKNSGVEELDERGAALVAQLAFAAATEAAPRSEQFRGEREHLVPSSVRELELI